MGRIDVRHGDVGHQADAAVQKDDLANGEEIDNSLRQGQRFRYIYS
jgi:hypothetical protein